MNPKPPILIAPRDPSVNSPNRGRGRYRCSDGPASSGALLLLLPPAATFRPWPSGRRLPLLVRLLVALLRLLRAPLLLRTDQLSERLEALSRLDAAARQRREQSAQEPCPIGDDANLFDLDDKAE